MRIALRDLGLGGGEVTLPFGDLDLTFALGPTRELSGTAELLDDHIVTRDLRIACQTIRAGQWALPDLGSMSVTEHLFATGVSLDADLPLADPLGLVGRLGLEGLLVERLRVSAAGVEAELRLALQHLELTQTADRARSVAIDRVDVHELTAGAAIGSACLGQITLTGLILSLDAAGQLELTCEELQVDSIELKTPWFSAQLSAIALSELHHGQGRTRLGGLTVGSVSLEVTKLPLAALLPPPAPAAPRGPFVAPRLPDLPFLDDLQGRVAIDAYLDVGIPVIKSRAATHTIRQELIDGTIDFKRLEAGLSGLEDAVLDFEVKPGKLILEKDIPLLPFDNTTLVWWPLEPREQELAKRQHRVRLRRLLDYTLTDFVTSKLQPSARGGGPMVTLRRIELNEVDVDISMGGPSRLELLPFAVLQCGAEGQPAVRRARVSGAVKLAPGIVTAPTRLAVELEGIAFGLERLELYGLTAALESLTVAAVSELSLTFDGLLPSAAQTEVTDIALRGLSLEGLELPSIRL